METPRIGALVPVLANPELLGTVASRKYDPGGGHGGDCHVLGDPQAVQGNGAGAADVGQDDVLWVGQ